jgi:hypothetical protein
MIKKISIIISGLVLITLAGIFFYAAFDKMPESNKWWKDNSIRTTGEIVEFRSSGKRYDNNMYPVIRFVTFRNEEIEFVSYLISGSSFTTGSKIPVRYLEHNPKSAEVDIEYAYTSPVIASIAFGFFLLVSGTILAISGVKKKI